MIRRVRIRNFRALRSVDVRLDRFHLLIGANASGKSTFFDALTFLRDILVSDLPRAVFGAPTLGIAARCADPRELTWQKKGEPIEFAVELALPESVKEKCGYPAAQYELKVECEPDLRIGLETLYIKKQAEEQAPTPQRTQSSLLPDEDNPVVLPPRKQLPEGWKKVVEKTSKADRYTSETKRWVTPFKLGVKRSTLGSVPEDEEQFPAALFVKRMLATSVFSLALSAPAMRRPAPAGLASELSPDGANLPWVIERLARERPERFASWQEHVRTALPDVQDVKTAEREEDRSRYLVVRYRGGLEVPAWAVSDGTLRLLALTLLAYVQLPASLVLIEEPENGLHPQALETVLQSLRSVYEAQLLAASHSPIVLGLLEPKDLLCFSKDKSGAVVILRGDEHPRLAQWREHAHLPLLFATGLLGGNLL